MSKSIDVLLKTVTREVNTRKPGALKGPKGVPSVPDSTVSLTVDFSQCTEAQLLDLAERSVVIAWQSKLRASEVPSDWDRRSERVDASEFLRTERIVDNKAAAAKAFARLTDAERKELLQSLKK